MMRVRRPSKGIFVRRGESGDSSKRASGTKKKRKMTDNKNIENIVTTKNSMTINTPSAEATNSDVLNISLISSAF